MREVKAEVIVTPFSPEVRHSRPDLLMALLALLAENFPECCLEQPQMIVELAKASH